MAYESVRKKMKQSISSTKKGRHLVTEPVFRLEIGRDSEFFEWTEPTGRPGRWELRAAEISQWGLVNEFLQARREGKIYKWIQKYAVDTAERPGHYLERFAGSLDATLGAIAGGAGPESLFGELLDETQGLRVLGFRQGFIMDGASVLSLVAYEVAELLKTGRPIYNCIACDRYLFRRPRQRTETCANCPPPSKMNMGLLPDVEKDARRKQKSESMKRYRARLKNRRTVEKRIARRNSSDGL